MKAHYRTASGRITFEIEGETPKDLFKKVAGLQEVFEAETTCGCCEGKDIRFQVRTVEDNDYFELVCQDINCRARFQFGQNKKGGGLFPKRRDESGWLANGGWSKWEGKKAA